MSSSPPSLALRVESAFEAWGRFVCRNRVLGIAVPILLSAFFVSWLPELEIDNSSESMLNEDDPAARRFDAFREQFGRDDPFLFAIRTPDVFDLVFLEKLRKFHRALENELPYVNDVTSLINARNTRGEGDTLVVEDLMERWPASPADIATLRERVLSNPLYQDTLISRDVSLTTVTVEPFVYSPGAPGDSSNEATSGFDEVDEVDDGAASAPLQYLTSVESAEISAAAKGVVDRFQAEDFEIFQSGVPALTDAINGYMIRDLTVYMGLAFVVIGALLYALFRRLLGVIIPMLVVFLSLATTLGIMVLLGLPGSAAAQMLPVFLLAVGICDSVHILVIVYQRLASGDGREDAIAHALGHSGLAVAMTSATTAAGMISFAGSELAPVAVLGVIAPIGVAIALLYSLVLLPALLASVPLVARSRRAGSRTSEVLGDMLARTGVAAARRPAIVLVATAAISVVALLGVGQVRFSHNAMNWFPEGEPLPAAVAMVDDKLNGSVTLEAVIHTGAPEGLYDPAVLRRIEAAMRRAETIEEGPVFVGKATSIVDIVKETHRALNENRPDHYVLPEGRQLIAQELLLFEQSGTDDLESIVDTRFSLARLSLRIPWTDALLYPPFITRVERELRQILGAGLELEMTGLIVVLAHTFEALLTSMTRSYVIAFLLITPMMMLLLGSFGRGLLSMIPNLLPVLLTLGLMGWLDIPLDISTIMIGAIVIGLAVDDTIHFMHKFQRYYEDLGDPYLAIHSTLKTTGAALLFTTLVLTGGFGIIAFGTLVNIQNFGMLLAFATVAAFLADLLVSPALMALVTRQRPAEAERPAPEASTAA